MLRTHKALPLNRRLDLVKDVMEETVVVIRRRVCGGMMSFSAAIRSYRVSFSMSMPESVEISESAQLRKRGELVD